MHSAIAALLGAALVPANAVALGDFKVHSYLGQPFEASLFIALSPGEVIDDACMDTRRIDAEEGDFQRGMHYRWQTDGDGSSGILHVSSANRIIDPMVQIKIVLHCNQLNVTRNFTVLLDPQNYSASDNKTTTSVVANAPVQPIAPPVSAAPAPLNVPTLGQTWQVHQGESLKWLADFFFPNERPLRVKFVNLAKRLNPQVQQGAYDLLTPGVQLRLPTESELGIPPRDKEATRSLLIQAESAQQQPADASMLKQTPPKPAPAAAKAPAPSKPGNQDSNEPRLTLSHGAPGKRSKQADKGTEASEQLRKMSERESKLYDELAEVTARQKDTVRRIEQQERQIAFLQGEIAKRELSVAKARAEAQKALEAAQPDPLQQWLPVGAAALAIVAIFFSLRAQNRKRRMVNEADLQTVIDFERGRNAFAGTDAPARVPGASERRRRDRSDPGRDAQASLQPAEPEAEPAQVPAPVITVVSQSVPPDESTSVNEANNLNEEINLLLEAGFVNQAINIIRHEIEKSPSTVYGWLRLFDIYCAHKQRNEFIQTAREFRTRFISEALWAKVVSMAQALDIEPSELQPKIVASDDIVFELEPQIHDAALQPFDDVKPEAEEIQAVDAPHDVPDTPTFTLTPVTELPGNAAATSTRQVSITDVRQTANEPAFTNDLPTFLLDGMDELAHAQGLIDQGKIEEAQIILDRLTRHDDWTIKQIATRMLDQRA
ncbi:hypothetical protein KSF73_09745 [Burkholderiaceae bacterium DAT-1]|nr:hypothetical protein [Burkholderiaceae bacterium DAT-1]